MKRCNGCFENLRDDLDICPFCGYYDGSSGDPDYLLPGTMLSGRYQIGNLLDYDGTNATYIALDTNADKKVEIKEFFPNDCATRGSDGSVNPREDHKSVFDEGFQGFVEEAKRLFGNGGAVKVYDCVAENNTAYMIMKHVEKPAAAPVTQPSQPAYTPSPAQPAKSPSYDNSTPKAAAKQSDKPKANLKKIGTLAIVAAVVIVILVGAYIAIKNFTNWLTPASVVYLSDGEYQYLPYLKSKNTINLDSAKTDKAEDYLNESSFAFSPDGKYVYYYTKIDEDYRTGTLCRAEINKIKSNSASNDQYIETIASNVKIGFRLLDSGYLLFAKDGGVLCCYNGKETYKITKDYYSFYSSKDGKQLIYLIWEEDNESYSLYGCNLKTPDNKIKLAKNVYSVPFTNDFNNILYYKETDEDELSLYVVGFEKESEKVAKDAKVFAIGEDYSYYIMQSGSVNLYDYVIDDSSDNSKQYLRETLRDEYNNKPLYDIYMFKNGSSTLICKNVVDYRSYSDVIMYNTIDMITEKVNINDIYDKYDVFEVFKIDDTANNYVLTLNNATPMTMTDQGAEILAEAYEEGSANLYATSDYLFILNDAEELYAAKIEKNNTIGHFDQISDDVSGGYVKEDTLYYRSGVYEEHDIKFYDLHSYKNGKDTRLAWDMSSPEIYEDSCVIGVTDKSSNTKKYQYEITMYYPNGNKVRIAEDVTWHIRIDKKTVLYLSDGDLYTFNGKTKTRIGTDVDIVWCSKYMKPL